MLASRDLPITRASRCVLVATAKLRQTWTDEATCTTGGPLREGLQVAFRRKSGVIWRSAHWKCGRCIMSYTTLVCFLMTRATEPCAFLRRVTKRVTKKTV